ncbi:hypothetical protein [Phaeovulum vinaykumarii]|uniref:Uncharacterized protein n=1 Tax=Phaeovulum vinaykumarii TaxID=407234 RepID=A0A1N7JMD7_9RHOB|nr:hypothetical protein [Phaeovulum vinaykumarii]SIS50523.1 hypothetical protein SAMN05421795_101162 [Phaeovulum vinaykumarii]SOB90301.1 hypothetical protein SAMN05878426_101162 [Phaeovulum vinaykumarii]
MKFPVVLPALLLGALPSLALADMAATARDYANENLMQLARDPAIVSAILAQNDAHAGLTPAQIDALDKTWRAEIDSAQRPMIDALLGNTASEHLRAQIEDTGGFVVEAFVMDNLGLNVAAAAPTSDYWQGDEAKFSETYPQGAGAIHVSDVEFDESSQRYQVQVSFTVTDPQTDAPIGAMTVALDAEMLE